MSRMRNTILTVGIWFEYGCWRIERGTENGTLAIVNVASPWRFIRLDNMIKDRLLIIRIIIRSITRTRDYIFRLVYLKMNLRYFV